MQPELEPEPELLSITKPEEVTPEMYPEPDLPEGQLAQLRERARVNNTPLYATEADEQTGHLTPKPGQPTPPQQQHAGNNIAKHVAETEGQRGCGAQWPPLPPPPRRQLPQVRRHRRTNASNLGHIASIDEELSHLASDPPTPTPPGRQPLQEQLQQHARSTTTPEQITGNGEPADYLAPQPPPPIPPRQRPSLAQPAGINSSGRVTAPDGLGGIDEQPEYPLRQSLLPTELRRPSQTQQVRATATDRSAKFGDEERDFLNPRVPPPAPARRLPAPPAQVQSQPALQQHYQHQRRQPHRQPLCYQPSHNRSADPSARRNAAAHEPSPPPPPPGSAIRSPCDLNTDEKMALIDEFLAEEDEVEVRGAGAGHGANDVPGDAMIGDAIAELDRMLRELDDDRL